MSLYLPKTSVFRKASAFLFVVFVFLLVPHHAYAHIQGTVFIDSNENGIQDKGEVGYPSGAKIHIVQTGGSGSFDAFITTDSSGKYFQNPINCPDAIYTVTLALPNGYHSTTPNPVTNLDASNCAQTVNFGITNGYTIAGNVFLDTNKNGIIDANEQNYTNAITVHAGGGAVSTTNGTYIISGLSPGTYTVSYTSLPNGYFMTSPLNGPPPSFTVTVGQGICNVNGAPGAQCTSGNVQDLNFGMSNNYPWIQSACGDIRFDNGIINNTPSGQYTLITNSSCNDTPVAFIGNTSSSFGQGAVSQTNQIVGGSPYAELYAYSPVIQTSYTSLFSKAMNAQLTLTNLATVCSLSDCTLPADLPHGIYIANGDVVLNTYTFPKNQNYVFLINGNLFIQGNISVPDGSTALFSTANAISIAPTVGSPVHCGCSSLDGWYVAGQSFIVNSAGNCNDLRLNIYGTVVVNAERNGGTFQNNRDLCSADTTTPSVSFTQRFDFILNAPEFVRQEETILHEVTP